MPTTLIPRSDLGTTPTERLEAEATTLAGHLAAAMCRFLDVVAELTHRRAWEAWETRSMAHWVSWKCGIGIRAAQEHVRVAVALTDLPETRAAFANGTLSYSKVRALTRFITPGRETDTVELAHHTTASHLERIAQAHVAACRAADPDRTRAAMDASHVSMHTNADDTITVTCRLPADLARRFLHAVDHAARELPPDPGAEPNTKRVHGLAAVVDTYLEPDPSRAAVEVVVHVDVDTLTEDTPARPPSRGTPSPPRPSAASPATPASASASTATTPPSTSAVATGTRTPRCAAPSNTATTTPAASPVAPNAPGCAPTTSATGPTAARPTATTSSCSAPPTTDRSTKAGGRSNPTPPVASRSSTPTAGSCRPSTRPAR